MPTLQELPTGDFPEFFVVDKYKDLSLKDIMDISDTFLVENVDKHERQENAASTSQESRFPVAHSLLSPSQSSRYMPAPMSPEHPVKVRNANQSAFSKVNTQVSDSAFEPIPFEIDSDSLIEQPLFFPPAQCGGCWESNHKVGLQDTFEDENSCCSIAFVGEDELDASDISVDHFSYTCKSPTLRRHSYQKGQWDIMFDELCDYRQRFGDCLVHHNYHENLRLARWVKRQRYQYKLMLEGKKSSMTKERAEALDCIGFVWNSQGAAWYERLSELREFKKAHGHYNVPSNFKGNVQLARWVKCQRRQYRLYQAGLPSNMTKQRIRALKNMGFEWSSGSKKRKRISP